MEKHRFIEKYLNLDISNKIPLWKNNISRNEQLERLLYFIDNRQWFHDGSVLRRSYHLNYNIDFNNAFIFENENNIIINYKEHYLTSGFYFDPNEDFVINFYINDIDSSQNLINFYCHIDSNKELLKEFINNNINYTSKDKKSLQMGLLVQNAVGQYDIKYHPVKPIINLNIEDNYNDDFININSKLINDLNNKNKSLNILHGLPGTGKTTYIKYLCYKLAKEDKRIIYLSPNITSILSSPQFIANLELFKDSIVIIEDAESILIKSIDRSQALTNILNITDGILSDIYNIHFIFTFNTDIKNIDEALLRKGRLNLKYEFKELSTDKAANLSKKLGVDLPNKCTLSEIYNIEDTGVKSKNTVKLGF